MGPQSSSPPIRDLTSRNDISDEHGLTVRRKKHKELLSGTTSEGLGYGENQAAILSESGATLPTSVQVDHGKAQFDFGQTTPHKKCVKHRNIMGGDGEVMDVTSMEEDEIKALLKRSE